MLQLTSDPLFPAARFAVFDGLAYPSYLLPAVGYAAPPPPSPCERLARLRVLWGGLTPAAASRHLASWFSVTTAPCRTRTAAGLPSSRPLLSLHMPRAKDPGAVTGRKPFFSRPCCWLPCRQPCRPAHDAFNGAEPLQRGASLLRPAEFPVYAYTTSFGFPFLFHSANTRYEWMASPYPAGTCTPQEAPSFAWRTTDKARDKVDDSPERARHTSPGQRPG